MNSSEQTHATPLVYMAALDHRDSFRSALGRIRSDRGPARRRELKLIVWTGLAAVFPRVAERARVCVLIDRGNERIARETQSAGGRVALALEESGSPTLRPEAGYSILRRELRSLQGGYGKVLLRWHPDDPDARKLSQLAVLRRLNDVGADSGAELLLELLIHPRPSVGTGRATARRWEDSVLPTLQHQAVEEILGHGMSPALWKMEGHANSLEAARVDALVGSSRPDAGVLILGGGSDIGDLRQAFSCGAGNRCFRGFAVGRSIWQEPILGFCRGEITQSEAESMIGDNFLAVVDAYEWATRSRVGQC